MNFESLTELTTYLQRGISPKYAESGIPVINQKCIRNGQLRKVDIKFHSSEKTYSQEKELRKDDILVNSTGVGTLGRVARFSSEDEKILADSHVTIVRPDVEKVFPLYLFYVLRLNEATIVELGAGSTGQTELSRTALGSLQIPIPSQSIQKYVADTLVFIDEKIDTNETLSKTLEDIAQTIFKSWFIDFDPVKAKMAGEKPAGMDAATAALFPDSLVESELGLIPKGWDVSPVGDAIDVGGGTTPSTTNSKYWDGEHCWTTPKDLSSQNGIITTSSKRRITDLGLAQISSGLLPINSVLMSCRAPIGYVSINAVPTAVNQGFITLKNSTEFHPLFVLNWINANMQEILNRAGGATFAEITRKAFRDIPFLKPANNVMRKYAELAEPLLKELVQLTIQTENLETVRDLLLPRLISGELQIPDEMLAS